MGCPNPNVPSLHYSSIFCIPALHQSIFLLLESAEDLLGVFLKDLFFVLRLEPLDAFNVRPHVVVPFARARIGLGAGAGPLGAKQAAVRTDNAEEQLQRLDVVQRRVEVKLLQSLIESFRIIRAAELGAPAADLI